MNNSANENLRELLAGFMDETAALQTAEDIEKGEEILGANQSPQPDERVLAEVKKTVVAALRRRRSVVLQRRILGAAVAAAVIVVSVMALMRYGNLQNSQQTMIIATSIPARVWEGPGQRIALCRQRRVHVVPGVDGVGTLEDGSRVYFTFARKPWGSMCEGTVAPRSGACRCPTGWTTCRPRPSPIPACRHGFR